MKHKNYLLLLLILIYALSTGCKNKAVQKTFNQYGISFNYPSDWKIDDVTDLDESYYYISVEKTGFNSSGIITIIVIEEEIDLVELITDFQENLSSVIYNQLKVEDITETQYGQYAAVYSKYTANMIALPHEGRMYAFSANGKTVYIDEEESVKDKEKNAAGFETIRKTLKIE